MMQPLVEVNPLPGVPHFGAAGSVDRAYAGPSFESLFQAALAARSGASETATSSTTQASLQNIAPADVLHVVQRAEGAYQAAVQITQSVAQAYHQIIDIRI